MRKVRGYFGNNFQERTIHYMSYAIDFAMVIVHELHIVNERTKYCACARSLHP